MAGAIGIWCLAAPAQGQDGFPEPLQKKFATLDKNGDGKLQKSELGDEQAFVHGDVDKDGVLTPTEAYRLHLIVQGKGLGSTQKLVDGFRGADEDKNGWLTLEEFPTGKGSFEAMDRDKDGKLTLPEAVRYQVALEMAEFVLDEDLDGDGKLSRSELPKTARPFLDLADVDKDGKLNEKEIYQLVVEFRLAVLASKQERAGKPSRPGAKSQLPSSLKTKSAGKDAVSQLQGALEALDLNKDGKLEASEVVLSRALFTSLDQNGDHAIDAAELRLAAGRRDRLVERARAIGKRIKARKNPAEQAQLIAIKPELEGLLSAGRIKAAELLVDEVELRLLRAPQVR